MKPSKTYLVNLVVISSAIFVIFAICLRIYGAWYDNWTGLNTVDLVSDGYCNIAVIPVVGDITSQDAGTYTEADFEDSGFVSADQVIANINRAEMDPNIAGIVLRIDSRGGEPVASEMIMEELRRSSLPTAALIRDAGASGGYLAATGAERIFASEYSDIGSIGVTMSYLDNSKKNTQEGVEYVELTSARFKDYANPDRPLTGEERALLQRDLKVWHDVFVKQVARNRGMTMDAVQKLADGSSMPGALALEAGLIDQIGDKEAVREWFSEQLDLDSTQVTFCN